MRSIRDTITAFLNSKQRNSWIKLALPQGALEVYMRKGFHMHNNVLLKTIDVASISAHPERRGMFTQFLDELEQIAKEKGTTIFVESIHNPFLMDFLRRRHYLPQYLNTAYHPGSCLIKSFLNQ